jgi:hypothetical protein
MRICLIHSQLGPIFRGLGHEVLDLDPPPGLFDLKVALEQAAFVPDLLLQSEALGPRLLLTGLESVPGLKIFWSIDTHLNAHWHAHYGALFDAVATTQQAWVARLRTLGLPQVFHLPVAGFVAPWKPFAKRPYPIAFCGRIGPKRPLRGRFVQFLRERFQATIAENIPQPRMVQLLGDTRIAPNECIAGEINFRIFEAASLGCAVLTPASPDLEALFTPGRELDTYANILELEAKLDHWLSHPDALEQMGLRARKRILTDHLPVHRAQTLLAALPSLAKTASRGRQAALQLQLTLVDLLEVDQALCPPSSLAQGLTHLPDCPEAAVGLIRFYASTRDSGALSELLHAILGDNSFPDDPRLNATGSLAAMQGGSFDLAKLFWARHHRADPAAVRPPETPTALLQTWAGVWTRLGRDVRLGFEFDPSRHVPQTSLETMILAYSRDPKNLALVRAMDSLLSGLPGTEATRLAFLSELSLHEPRNWRLGLRLGLVNLGAFRQRQGIEELHLAGELARAQNETPRFLAALAHEDSSGAIRRTLGEGL